MLYAMTIVTESDIKDGHYWRINDILDTKLSPTGYCDDNALQLSRQTADFIVQHSDCVGEPASEALSEELAGQIISVTLWSGQTEKILADAIRETVLAVFGAETEANRRHDDYWQHVGGALMHTVKQNQVMAWSSVLLSAESHYYPSAYR